MESQGLTDNAINQVKTSAVNMGKNLTISSEKSDSGLHINHIAKTGDVKTFSKVAKRYDDVQIRSHNPIWRVCVVCQVSHPF